MVMVDWRQPLGKRFNQINRSAFHNKAAKPDCRHTTTDRNSTLTCEIPFVCKALEGFVTKIKQEMALPSDNSVVSFPIGGAMRNWVWPNYFIELTPRWSYSTVTATASSPLSVGRIVIFAFGRMDANSVYVS